MVEVKINITVSIGSAVYTVADSHEVNTEEWDAEGIASEHLECLSFRMKSAIEPCFWDHETVLAKRNAEEK